MQTDRLFSLSKVCRFGRPVLGAVVAVWMDGQALGQGSTCSSYSSMFDLDGNGIADFTASDSYCSGESRGPDGPVDYSWQNHSVRLAPGAGFWIPPTGESLPWGMTFGTTNPPTLVAVTNYYAAVEARLSGFAVPQSGGGVRFGWIQYRASEKHGYVQEIELAPGTNQPVTLGLPAEPRWLPRLKSGVSPVSATPTNEVAAGIIRRFGRSTQDRLHGVAALTFGHDGRLWGVSQAENSTGFQPFLFTVRPDGSDYREVVEVDKLTPLWAYEISTTDSGLVFLTTTNGPAPVYRYQPDTAVLTRLRSGTANRTFPVVLSALTQLGDGRLYGSTTNGFVRLEADGSAPAEFSLGATGVTNFSRGVTESGEWLYLVAKSGGIVRCRRDGTEATVWSKQSAWGSGLVVARAGGFFQQGWSLLSWSADGEPVEVARHPYYSNFHFGWWGTASEDFGPLRGFSGSPVVGDDGFLYGHLRGDNLGAIYRVRPEPGASAADGRPPLVEILTQSSELVRSGVDSGRPVLIKGPDGTLFAGTDRGIFSFRPGQHGLVPILRLGSTGIDGRDPVGPMLHDGNGNLVGVAEAGGLVNEGAIYSARVDGSGGAVLHAFTGGEGDVLNPSGFLVLGTDGWYYGTSQRGDRHDFTPKLYRLHTGTGEFQVVATLPGRFEGDEQRRCGLLRASDGLLYGTTPRGGRPNLGTLFRYDPAANRFQVIHEFGLTVGDTWQAWPELLESRDGFIYGLAQGTGTNQLDSDGVFRIAKDGAGYQVIERLVRRGTALQLAGGLCEASDGHLYAVRGLSDSVTTNDTVSAQIIRVVRHSAGAVPATSEVVFENLIGQEPFIAPVGRLVEAPDGWLVGNSTSYQTAVYRLKPASGAVERFARDGIGAFSVAGSGGAKRFSVFAPPLPLANGDVVVALDSRDPTVNGSLRRVSKFRPPAPKALGELSLGATYGHPVTRRFTAGLFSGAYEILDVQVIGADSKWGSVSANLNSVYLSPLRVGEFRIRLVAGDGSYPPVTATNWINLSVRPAPLQVTGQTWIQAVGSSDWFPTGGVSGVQNNDQITVEWVTSATTNSPAGEYPVEPVLHDPDNRLGNYQVIIKPSRIKLVDPRVKPELTSAGLVLNFPGIPGKRFVIEQADTLDDPVWTRRVRFMVISETTPPFSIPIDDSRPTHFVRVTME